MLYSTGYSCYEGFTRGHAMYTNRVTTVGSVGESQPLVGEALDRDVVHQEFTFCVRYAGGHQHLLTPP